MTLDLTEAACVRPTADQPRKAHGNSRRTYPFWKTCTQCGDSFAAHTRDQATRNKTCGRACKNAQISISRTGGRPVETHKLKSQADCSVCGSTFWRNTKWLERVTTPVCSYQCNGALRGAEWGTHAHKARPAWSLEAEAHLVVRMTGCTNPAWKGGVTYRRRRGNYASVKYVRCPMPLAAMSRKDGYVMHHRLIVAQHVGRCLTRTECVHHIDHNPLNNRVDNLMLFATNQDHKRFEAGWRVSPLWSGARIAAVVADPAGIAAQLEKGKKR